MILIASFIVGVLFAGATYLLLQRNAIRILLGLILLTHASSLLIFTMSIMPERSITSADTQSENAAATSLTGEVPLAEAVLVVDPLSQALVISSMVISVGLIVFVLVVIYRMYQAVGSHDLDDLTSTADHQM